jgi:hypothetical protein
MADEKINELIDLANIQSQIDATKKGINEIIALMEKAAQGSAGISGGISGKGLSETSAAAKDNKKAIDELVLSEKFLLEQERKVHELRIQAVRVESGHTNELIRQKIATKEVAKEAELKVRMQLSEIGSLDNLRAKYGLLLIEYNKMTQAQKEGTQQGQALTSQLSELKTQIVSAEKATGNFTGQVGNYEIAAKSVKSQLKEVRNELQLLISQGAGVDNPKVIELSKKYDSLSDAMAKAKNNAELMDKAGMMAGFVKTVGALAATMEVARGATALFGNENEDLQKVMVKIQASIAMVHGLEVLSNALRKESTVYLFLQNAALKIKNLFTIQSAAATTVDTAATAANTVANENAVVTQKALNTAQKANWWAILATVVIAAGTAIYAFTKKSKELTDVEKIRNANIDKTISKYKELNNSLGEEQLNVKLLFNAVTKENISKEKRTQLITEINSSYGKYLPNLLTEESSLNDIKTAQEGVNSAIIANIKTKLISEKAETYVKESMNLEDLNTGYNVYLSTITKVNTEAERLYNESLERNKGEADAITIATGVKKRYLNTQKETNSLFDKALTEANMNATRTGDALDYYTQKVESNKTAISDNATVVDGLADKYSNLLPQIYDHSGATTEDTKNTTDAYEKLTAKISEYEKKILGLIALGKNDEAQTMSLKLFALKAEKEGYDEAAKALTEYYTEAQKLEALQKVMNDDAADFEKTRADGVDAANAEIDRKTLISTREKSLTKDTEAEILQIEADAIREKLLNINLSNEEREKLEQDLQDALFDIKKDAADKQDELDLDQLKKDKEIADAKMEIAQSVVDSISEITKNNRDYEYDQKLSALEKAKKAELEDITLTEAEKAAIESDYEKKKTAILHKQWEKEKEAALIMAAIKGALAVISELASAGPAAAWAAGVAAAAAIIVILAKKNPYEKGRIGGPAEWATVAEKGTEGLLDKHGKLSFTPNTKTITWLDEGTSVIPHDQLINAMYDSPSLSADSFSENIMNSLIIADVIKSENKKTRQAIMNKKELNIRGSLSGGIEYEVSRGNSKTRYINDNIRL